MNLFRRLMLKAAAYTAGASFNPMNHDMVQRVFGGTTSSAGKSVTAANAMTLSAAWSCMRILSETIGSLPWAIYKRDAKGNAQKDPTHQLHQVLADSPNRHMTSTEFREAMVLNLCQTGNAYALIERLGGKVASLVPVPSSLVEVVVGATGAITYKINLNGKPTEYPQEAVWHVKGFGPTGLVGLSPIAAAREAMGFALAVDEFGSRFFAQGGKPSGVVTIPNFLTQDQRKIARENLQQMLGGMGNAHKFALFEGGMKPEPWGVMPLQDMEFLLLRKFSVQEICRFYRVPPHMVADLDKATFSNIEQQSQEFVNYTLLPYFTRFESSAAKWLLTPQDRAAGYFLRFNAEGLLRGDSAARAALYSQMLQNGVMNRNEVRALENLNASDEDGMDDFTVQSNLIMVGDLEGKAEREAEAAASRGFGSPAKPSTEDSPTKTMVINAPQPVNLQMGSEVAEGLRKAFEKLGTEGNAKLLERLDETVAEVRHAVASNNANTAAALKAAADAAARAEQMVREHSADVASVTTLAFERSEEAIKGAAKEMVAAASKPRLVVFNDKGEPIGTKPVDRI